MLTPLLIISAVVALALAAEYVGWLHTTTARYPTARSLAWSVAGFVGYLIWIGFWPLAAALLLFCLNVLGLLLIVEQLAGLWVLWRAGGRDGD